MWRPAPRLFATRQPGKHNRVRHGRVPDTIIVGHASALPPKADISRAHWDAPVKHETSSVVGRYQKPIETYRQPFCTRTGTSYAAHHVSLWHWLDRYKISRSPFSDLGSSGTGRMSAPRPFPSQSQHTRVPHPVLFSCPWSLPKDVSAKLIGFARRSALVMQLCR